MRNGVRMCRKVLTTLTRPMVMPRPNTIGRNFMPRRSDQMNSSSIGQPTIISLVRGRMTSVFSRKLRNASSVLEVVAGIAGAVNIVDEHRQQEHRRNGDDHDREEPAELHRRFHQLRKVGIEALDAPSFSPARGPTWASTASRAPVSS